MSGSLVIGDGKANLPHSALSRRNKKVFIGSYTGMSGQELGNGLDSGLKIDAHRGDLWSLILSGLSPGQEGS